MLINNIMERKYFLLAGGDVASSRAARGIHRIAHGSLAALGMTRGVGGEMPGGDRGCGQSGRTGTKVRCYRHRTPASRRGSRWQVAGGWARGSPEPFLVFWTARILRAHERAGSPRSYEPELPALRAEDHRERADAAQEVGVVADRLADDLGPEVALQHLAPQDLELQLGEAVADAAVDAGAERQVLADLGPLDPQRIG